MSAITNTTRLFEPVLSSLVDAMDTEFKPFAFSGNRRWRTSEFREKDDGYFLELEVPGFSKKDISITLDQNTLIVKGKVDRNEVSYNLDKAFSLPIDVNPKAISAKLENGLLTISLSKLAPPKESVIKIT